MDYDKLLYGIKTGGQLVEVSERDSRSILFKHQ